MSHCISTQTPEVIRLISLCCLSLYCLEAVRLFISFAGEPHPSHSFWKKFEPRHFESTATQSLMEKGSHCLYLMWETGFVNSWVLGTFWLPRNYKYYLPCRVFASDPVPEMGKTVQTLHPWSLGYVSETLLCHCGSRATSYHCQNVPYFPCCAEKLHFLCPFLCPFPVLKLVYRR